MASKDYEEFSKNLIENLGGKENIISMMHCMTRLRVNLVDMDLVKIEEIKGLSSVLGAQWVGSQLQVIIGPEVAQIYEWLCKHEGIQAQEQVSENLDASKESFSIKKLGNSIMNYITGSIVPLIPAMMTAALFKALQSVLGPTLLGVISAESDFYILTEIVYHTFFYFIPIFIGGTAAKKLGMDFSLGLFLGAVLVAPGFIALESFTIFGINVQLQDYSGSIFPMLITMAFAKPINVLLKKYIPSILAPIFVPFLTVLIIIPFEITLLAPLGGIMTGWLTGAFEFLGNTGGFISVGIIGALWSFLVMTGMHVVLVQFGMINLMQLGFDNVVFLGAAMSTWAVFGMAFGALLKLRRNKKERANAAGYLAAGLLGSITEPALYGIGFRYKKPFVAMALGGLAGGVYAGAVGLHLYLGGHGFTNFVLSWLPGGTANLINGMIAQTIAITISAVGTYIYGFKKEDLT